MKYKYLLSIICPVYNANKTLDRLMESLVSKYKSLYEIIFIDDGSSDDSLNILHEYAKKYSFVKTLSKKNTGVSDTRNLGIKKAQGKYITFVDSDDELTKDYFNIIIPLIKNNEYNLLCFKMNMYVNGKLNEETYDSSISDIKGSEQNNVINYLNGKYCYLIGNGPCNKIYSSEIIKKYAILFNTDQKNGEDLIFNIQYVSKINDFSILNEALYNYYVKISSVFTKKKYNSKNLFELFKFYSPLNSICDDIKLENANHFMGLFFLRRIPGVIFFELENPSFKDGKNNIKKFLNHDKIKITLKSIKFKNLDNKLLLCYILYKFHLFISIYEIMYLIKKVKG